MLLHFNVICSCKPVLPKCLQFLIFQPRPLYFTVNGHYWRTQHAFQQEAVVRSYQYQMVCVLPWSCNMDGSLDCVRNCN